MKNCIYFFTGTGNCLRLSQVIAAELPETRLIAICEGMNLKIPEGCERVGFVYPVYYLGLPAMVADFIRRAEFPRQDNTYYFAVATYGGFAGSSIPQLGELLSVRNITLSYGITLKMFSNCVTMYNMSKHVSAITSQSEQRFKPVIQAISGQVKLPARAVNKVIYQYHRLRISRVSRIGHGFWINQDCISCGICRNVCAAGNITMTEGKPVFGDNCEHCTACIQHCPKQAINFKNRTRNRRRYTHPLIGHQMLAGYYKYRYTDE